MSNKNRDIVIENNKKDFASAHGAIFSLRRIAEKKQDFVRKETRECIHAALAIVDEDFPKELGAELSARSVMSGKKENRHLRGSIPLAEEIMIHSNMIPDRTLGNVYKYMRIFAGNGKDTKMTCPLDEGLFLDFLKRISKSLAIKRVTGVQ